MGQEDDLRGLGKVMDLMRALSIILLIMHIYWFCYAGVEQLGWTTGWLEDLFMRISIATPLFDNILTSKIIALVFLLLSCFGTTK